MAKIFFIALLIGPLFAVTFSASALPPQNRKIANVAPQNSDIANVAPQNSDIANVVNSTPTPTPTPQPCGPLNLSPSNPNICAEMRNFLLCALNAGMQGSGGFNVQAFNNVVTTYIPSLQAFLQQNSWLLNQIPNNKAVLSCIGIKIDTQVQSYVSQGQNCPEFPFWVPFIVQSAYQCNFQLIPTPVPTPCYHSGGGSIAVPCPTPVATPTRTPTPSHS